MTDIDHSEQARDRKLALLLKDYPMPEAENGFYDQALARAVHTGSRRQRHRWLVTGFGTAVAAGILLLFVSGILFDQTDIPAPDNTIPGISIALAEPRTVNLMFAANEALDNARLTVLLPDGVELAGFPGQREVSWDTSLAAGKNVLPLKLIATSPLGGEILARLEHKDRNRTYRLRVTVG